MVEWFGEAKRDPPELVAPDPAWPVEAEKWIGCLRRALHPLNVRIEHVGSTAVPGLPAKPVIDVQVGVPDLADEAAYRGAIESLGLPLRAREQSHRFFRPPASEPRLVHVHVCECGSRWERDHLLFRDYLRAHPAACEDYERLKRRLVHEADGDRELYAAGKTRFISSILQAAEDSQS